MLEPDSLNFRVSVSGCPKIDELCCNHFSLVHWCIATGVLEVFLRCVGITEVTKSGPVHPTAR